MTVKNLLMNCLIVTCGKKVKVESFGSKKDIEEIEYDEWKREFIIKLK